MCRDDSVYGADDYTIYSKGGDGFPAEEIVDMLSEKNLEQFTPDQWIALYRQAAAVQEQKELSCKSPVRGGMEARSGAVEKPCLFVFCGHILHG